MQPLKMDLQFKCTVLFSGAVVDAQWMVEYELESVIVSNTLLQNQAINCKLSSHKLN